MNKYSLFFVLLIIKPPPLLRSHTYESNQENITHLAAYVKENKNGSRLYVAHPRSKIRKPLASLTIPNLFFFFFF